MKKSIDQSKIIRGCWQLSADHSASKPSIDPLVDAVLCGFSVFDCGDIYLGVEELLGKAAQALSGKQLHVHTKFVPDLNSLAHIDRTYVREIIDRSLKRLQVSSLDLVQFHWWDWKIPKYLPTLEFLCELKNEGKITRIGLTNVNSAYLEEITAHFDDIASLQIQVSLFDRRAEDKVALLCRKKNIAIFAYGSLLGGFVSKTWLHRQEPQLDTLPNRSLVKYKLLIDQACGWEEFQRRLVLLDKLATKYSSTIANIAISALLQKKRADSVIVGLSPIHFREQNRSLADLPLLSPEDLEEISGWSCHLRGDVYDEERDTNGVHAKVMKYNLNSSI